MYPEWIQEQLDKIAKPSNPLPTDERIRVQLGIMEARIIRVISLRFDRIEAKLDRLLAYCEGE